MKEFALAFALALGAATTLTTAVQAMPQAQSGPTAAAAALNPIEKTQFFLGGRHYCFYLDGWHGPGWYWCGYAYRRGFGWGGPEGWHGWHHGGVGPRSHMGPRHMGPGHMGPGRKGPGRMGSGHMGPGHMGPGHKGPHNH